MTQRAWPRIVRLPSLAHGSVEPTTMLFGDVGLVTSLPGFTLSSGVKCGADADLVPVGSLPVCSPRSCTVPPEVSGASRSAQRCFSRKMPHTHAAEDVSSVDPSLELTSCVSHKCDSGHSLAQASYVHEIACTCTSSGSYVVSTSQESNH